MIDAQKHVIRRGDIAPELILLEEQIGHILRNAHRNLIQNLLVGRCVYIQTLRWGQQQIARNPRVRPFEDDRQRQPIQTVCCQLPRAVIFADDARNMRESPAEPA